MTQPSDPLVDVPHAAAPADAPPPPLPPPPPTLPPTSPPTNNATPDSNPDKKKRRWGKRLRRLTIVVLLLVIASRFLGVYLLPTVLKKIAGSYGMDCTYERLDLSALGGDAGIWHVAFTPKAGGDPILRAEYCRGRVSILDLLRGKLAVSRLEADGVDLNLDRNADGSIPLLALLNQALKTSPTAPPAAPPSAPPSAPPAPAAAKPIDLNPPISLDALRLTHVQLHVRDRAANPPLDTTVSVNVRISDFGSTERPMRMAVDVGADPFLDALHVDAELHGNGQSVDANLSSTVQGLRLRPLAAYLQPLGIKPVANEISVRATGHLKASPSPKNPQQLAATLSADNIALIADGDEAAACEHFVLDADALDTRTIRLSQISIDGGRVIGHRAADGDLRFAGLELVPVNPSAPATAPTKTAAATPSAPLTLPVITLGQFTLKNSHASFHDEGVSPAVDLSFVAEDLSVKHVVFDPAEPDAAVELAGTFHAPGLINAAHVTGSVSPFAVRKSVKLTVSADGIAPTALKTYLDAIGIESTLVSASFNTELTAGATVTDSGIDADATLQGLKFKDSSDLIALDHVKLAGLGYHLKPARITLGDIEIAGPSLVVEHDASGGLAALGLRTKPRTISPVAASVASTSGSTPTAQTVPALPIVLPAIELKRFAWKDVHFEYDDHAISPPLKTSLKDAGVEIENIVLDLAATTPAAPGKIHAWASIPDLADSLSAEGTVTPLVSGVAIDLQLDGKGVTSKSAAPFLKDLGIEPTLTNGTLAAHVTANVSARDGASLAVRDAKYADGDRELAGIDALNVSGIQYEMGSPDHAQPSVRVDAIRIDRPRISVARDAAGAFELAGIRIRPDALSKASTQTLPPSPSPSPPPSSTQPATTRPVIPVMPSLDIALKSLKVNDASIAWSDAKVAPAVAIAAHADVELNGFSLAADAPPAAFKLSAKVDGSVDQAVVNGHLSITNAAPALAISVEAGGLRAGSLAAYLPPGLAVSLKNGRFKTNLEAGVANDARGGVAGKLIVNGLDYRDAGEAVPLFKVDAFRVIATRVDLPQRIAIEELSTAGVETAARRTADGGIALLGLTLRPVAEGAKPHAAAIEAPTAGTPAATQPATIPTEDVAAIVAQMKQSPVYITLGKLDLNVKRVVVTDLARPESAPLTLADLHVRNIGPVELGGRDAESKPPANLRVDCALDPIVGAVTTTLQFAPFAQQPSLVFDVSAGAIRGDGITELVPELKPMLDASTLMDGQFHVHSDTQLRIVRRGPYGVDLSRGLAADVSVKEIAFRGQSGGPVLAGLSEIHSDGIRVGGDGSVHVKTLEITKPIGRISREKDGIHALGLVLKLPTTAPATQTAAPAPAAQRPAVAEKAKPGPEIRIDQLLISDIDAQIADNTVAPPLVVPLNTLDVEVKGISSRMPYEDKPVTFSALVTAGKVRVPKRGMDAIQAEKTGGYEDRELFAQVTANGKLGLYPKPNGWVKTAVSGFELASLRSEAKVFSIDLTRGVFDNTTEAHLPGDGSAEVSTKIVATNLSLTEPPDGPIRKLLNLPAPLDIGIAAVQDADDSITIPASVPIKEGKLSPTDIGLEAGKVVGIVMGTAILNTPLKAMNVAGDLLGLGGSKKPDDQPISITFEPGYTAMDANSIEALAKLSKRLTKESDLNLIIRHELGGGDLLRAAQRSNPTPEEATAMAYQLRQQKLDAMNLRSDLAGEARSELSWGSTPAAGATLARLREVNRQIAETDEAIDHIYDLLRPGADRQAPRRTRGACLDYGKQRLDAVKSTLLANLPPAVSERVNTTNPQFIEATGDEGGKVIVTFVVKRKG